ncbi:MULTISPECIES: hypothetical protein [Thauera]|uniref:hypothetical protein n=1 Tax=Thauera TaxID=33057 RepID=UPI0012FB991D|nr:MULTISPECIES: hypothetical protein [Thauera]
MAKIAPPTRGRNSVGGTKVWGRGKESSRRECGSDGRHPDADAVCEVAAELSNSENGTLSFKHQTTLISLGSSVLSYLARFVSLPKSSTGCMRVCRSVKALG